MKKHLLILVLALLPLAVAAQTYSAVYPKSEWKEAKKWVKTGVWRNGFTKASLDKTVNLVDFKKQYEKNPEQWNALFKWLQTTDLLALKAGKYPIPGTTMTASIQDDTNKPLAERNTESHRTHIDFQYVVSGVEGFALLDHETSKANCEYNEKKDVIRYDYDKVQTKFFTNRKNHFNIFFPGDWHIAKVQLDKKNAPFRVVVVKVDYKG